MHLRRSISPKPALANAPQQSHSSLWFGLVVLSVAILAFILGRISAKPGIPSVNAQSVALKESGWAVDGDLSQRDTHDTSIAIADSGEASSWVKLSSWERLQIALQSPSDFNKWAKTLAITSQLAVDEIPDLLNSVNELTGDTKEILLAGLIARWAETDPGAATAWVTAKGEDFDHSQFLDATLSEWFARDPDGARAWFAGLHDPELKKRAVGPYVQSLAAHDPMAALAEVEADVEEQVSPIGYLYRITFASWAAKHPREAALHAAILPNAIARRRAIKGVLGPWVARAPQDAVAWVLTLSHDDERKSAMNEAYELWAYEDPQHAMQHAQLLSETMRNAAQQQVSEIWRQRDMPTFANWVLNEHPTNLDGFTIDRLITHWLETNPANAATWIETLPVGSSRDVATVAYVSKTLEKDTAAAIAWAETVSDPEMRASALQQVVWEWGRKDQNAATQWVKNTPWIDNKLRANLSEPAPIEPPPIEPPPIEPPILR